MRIHRSIFISLMCAIFLGGALPARGQSAQQDALRQATFDNLKSLDDVIAISGYEKQLGEQITSELAAFHPEVDNLGDIVITIGSGAPHRLLVTGIDEPGFVVSAITEDGFLRVQRLPQGGLTPIFNELYSAQPVKIGTASGGWMDGMVAGLSVHLSGRPNPPKSSDLDEMYIDVGATSAEEVRKAGINVLSPIAINRRLFNLGDRAYAAASMGDRFGAAALLELLSRIDPAKLKGTFTLAFVTQQRSGARGLRRILTKVQADEFIYVGRLFAGGPLPGSDNLRRAPRKEPSSGVLAGLEDSTASVAGLAADIKQLAETQKIPFATDYSASVIGT